MSLKDPRSRVCLSSSDSPRGSGAVGCTLTPNHPALGPVLLSKWKGSATGCENSCRARRPSFAPREEEGRLPEGRSGEGASVSLSLNRITTPSTAGPYIDTQQPLGLRAPRARGEVKGAAGRPGHLDWPAALTPACALTKTYAAWPSSYAHARTSDLLSLPPPQHLFPLL